MPESVPTGGVDHRGRRMGPEGSRLRDADEPYNCREYVVVHHRLGVDEGDRLLDVACGSGLALELAHLRGAACAGIDASQRLAGGGPRPQSVGGHPGWGHARASVGRRHL